MNTFISRLDFHYLTSFFHHYKSIGFKRIKNKCYLWCQSAWKFENPIFLLEAKNNPKYVFRIVFRTFLREFESVETTPGFAQLLGEKLDFQNDVEI